MTPIDHHGLLSDGRGLALVAPNGDVVWSCSPRPDAPPTFGALLDPGAGVFGVAPVDGAPLGQAYDGDTLILRTRFEGIDVVDYLDGTHLVRNIEGRGRVRIRFAPRRDLGRVPTHLDVKDGAVRIRGTDLLLCGPVDFRLQDDEAHAEVDVDGTLTLAFGPGRFELDEAARRREAAERWTSWLAPLDVPAELRRSALTLRALVYEPTGAIVAAATSSLPEAIGGPRNWDYRFCWPRDAAMTATTLARLGDLETGTRLFDWITARAGDLSRADMLEPLYTVDGETLPGEELREELAGYAGSRPVRIGNGAAGQVQLDVFGPVVELAATLAELGAPLDEDARTFVRRMLEAITRAWDRPGHGVWELRAAERHHVFSRGMCWLALTRGASLLEDGAEFLAVAERIRAQVADRGWSGEKRAYTMAYGLDDLDAAVLRLVGTGFFGDAERERATVDAIDAELRTGPMVYRYHMDDGLDGDEGGFFITSFWLVDALMRTGRAERARALFEELRALAGPLGLFAEEHDPVGCVALGNYPQAYSHLAFVDTWLRLSA